MRNAISNLEKKKLRVAIMQMNSLCGGDYFLDCIYEYLGSFLYAQLFIFFGETTEEPQKPLFCT